MWLRTLFTVTTVLVSGAINHVLFVYKFSQFIDYLFQTIYQCYQAFRTIIYYPQYHRNLCLPPLNSLCITFTTNRSIMYSYKDLHSTSATNHRPRIHAYLRSMDLMVYYGSRIVVSRRMS